MLKIQVLGSGCDKCKKLAANVKIASERLDLPCKIEKVEDINQITASGVMMTPALMVNGKVVSSGKVLTPDEIAGFLAAPGCDCSVKSEEPETENPVSSCCGGKSMEPASACCCGGGDETKSVSDGCCCCGGNKKIMTAILLALIVISILFIAVKHIRNNFPESNTAADGQNTAVETGK